MKTCRKCKQTKEETDFRRLSSGNLQARCRECHNEDGREYRRLNPDKTQEYYQRHRIRITASNKKWGAKNRDQVRVRRLRSQYGVDYSKMLEAQDGKCANPGCRRLESEGRLGRLDVDHDHVTGAVRGLLCNKCNTAAGLLEEDPKRINGLCSYLEAHGA